VLFERPEFPTSRCRLRAADPFLLYTHGIYEVANSRAEEYGRDRLFSTIRNHVVMPTERLLDAVVMDVQGFARTREFDDDRLSGGNGCVSNLSLTFFCATTTLVATVKSKS